MQRYHSIFEDVTKKRSYTRHAQDGSRDAYWTALRGGTPKKRALEGVRTAEQSLKKIDEALRQETDAKKRAELETARKTCEAKVRISLKQEEVFARKALEFDARDLFKDKGFSGISLNKRYLSWQYSDEVDQEAIHELGPQFYMGNTDNPPDPGDKNGDVMRPFLVAPDGCVRWTLGHEALGYGGHAIFAGEVKFDAKGYVVAWGNQTGTYECFKEFIEKDLDQFRALVKMMPFPKMKYGANGQAWGLVYNEPYKPIFKVGKSKPPSLKRAKSEGASDSGSPVLKRAAMKS